MTSSKIIRGFLFPALACLALVRAGLPAAAQERDDLGGSLVVILACGDPHAAETAVALGRSGDSVVHVIAGSVDEVRAINTAVADAQLKGIVSVEELGLKTLPYRDHLVSTLVVMDPDKAKAAGFTTGEARRCIAPFGKLATFRDGRAANVEVMKLPDAMDVWTHRYYRADGIPASQDRLFHLPLGFKWNAGLPMNFDNPKRSANRYSSTRAMVVDDGRVFSFSTAVYENLGQGWTSAYGTDQYLTCRDAFNGRLLWRKRIGDTYYGGLYIENMAPLVSTGRHLYLAGENGKMLKVDTRSGRTVREMDTAFIPGVIAADGGVVVTATWKQGKHMGSVSRYDRRRMDWAVDRGTVEAYDDATGKLLWKREKLATSLLIAEGRVLIVNRDTKDDLELNHRKPKEGLRHPPNRMMALDLGSGKVLWTSEAADLGLADQTLNLEAAASGAVSVATSNRSRVTIVSAETGTRLEGKPLQAAQQVFFRYRNHVCTPVYHVGDISLTNRGGTITRGSERLKFGGARSACLTGTIPAYGAGYIAQNWCNCSPGQIPGLLSVASIGKIPTPAEMERPAVPVTYGTYSDGEDGDRDDLHWTSFRGNGTRSSSSPCAIPARVTETWTARVAAAVRPGTVARDWRSYLNSRLTAPVLSGKVAIVGDIDHNEVIAVNLEDGRVAWRFMTGGRMDTPPTLHKGICLVGDHTGHVTALKVRNGGLIYRLRIAPEERRMLSYGKIESVWPVIGGVLVDGKRAYATAGRTQGSDGGLVVRAFEPETGKAVWARAIPQSGNGIKYARTRRNDALILQDGRIRLMEHYLDPETGAFVDDPNTILRAQARAAKEKELGRKLDRKEQKEVDQAVQKANPGGMAMGNEGVYSWNWTRLGHRKFQSIGYADVRGDTVSWNATHRAFVGSRQDSIGVVTAKGERKTVRLPAGSQGTSLVLCNNMVVQGGSLLDQGDKKGFIRAIDLETGKVAWEQTYGAPLAFNGLAVDGGAIVASFDDGTVVRLK